MDSFTLLNDKYILLKKIGQGGTCKVYLGKSIDEDNYFAVKILKSSCKGCQYEENEIANLLKLNHPNIINLIEGGSGEVRKPNGKMKNVKYLVLELAENGELFDYIYYPRQGLGEDHARLLFIQLIEGLENCHKSKVAHRDIKTENLMMDHNWQLKISDFGFSKMITNSKMQTLLGTYQYMAPELLAKKSYNGAAADLFSAGVVLFILVTGIPPFKLAKESDPWYKNFIKGTIDQYWETMTSYIGKTSDEFKSLITSILCPNPSLRPSIDKIIDHPWVKDGRLPTLKEYQDDFEKRKKITRMAKMKEAQQRTVQKAGGGKLYRDYQDYSICDLFKCEDLYITTDPDVESRCQHIIKLSGENYLDHLNFVANYFTENEKVAEVIPNKQNCAKFKVIYKQDVCEDDFEIEFEPLEIKVELKRIDDENFVAEFSKVNGERFAFYEEFQKISDALVK